MTTSKKQVPLAQVEHRRGGKVDHRVLTFQVLLSIRRRRQSAPWCGGPYRWKERLFRASHVTGAKGNVTTVLQT